MYCDIETRVVVNQSVNNFYTRFLFKIDALPQDVAFPLDIAATFFKNLRPDIREFLISEGVQVPPRDANWNQALGKPEAPIGQKCGSGIRKEDQNNISGGAARELDPAY